MDVKLSTLVYQLILVMFYRNFGDNAFPVVNTITAEKLHKLQQDLRRKVFLFFTILLHCYIMPIFLGGVL